MASGAKFTLTPIPPATTAATFNTFAGTSTPAETIPTLDFDAATDEFMDFYGEARGYGGGGLTLTIPWISAAATTGDCIWNAAIRAIPDDAEDLNTTAHTYDVNAVTSTTASAAGEVQYADITFTDGADMDSLANGEAFILRLSRDANNGSDTLAGDALLLWPALVLRET